MSFEEVRTYRATCRDDFTGFGCGKILEEVDTTKRGAADKMRAKGWHIHFPAFVEFNDTAMCGECYTKWQGIVSGRAAAVGGEQP